MKNLTFGKKVTIGVILVILIGILPLTIIGNKSLNLAEKALEHAARNQLTSLREVKKKAITTYFDERVGDAQVLAKTIESFKGEYEQHYPFLAQYAKIYGYYDLFLIQPKGYIFYSSAKEADYKTNLLNGKYADSGLGTLFRKVKDTRKFAMVDFEPYAPSNGEPAAFIGYPVLNKAGELEVVVALQLPLEGINQIMQIRDGMGETGETYLVGEDRLMRSDSFLDPTNHSVKASFANPSLGKVDTRASNQSQGGKTAAETTTDYNGNEVISAYTSVQFHGITWSVIADIDMAEVDIPIIQLRNQILWAGGITLAVVFCVVLLIIVVARKEVIYLGEVVANLTGASEQVAAASEQISSGAQQLSQGATEQAASLEEVSASMEQVSSQAKGNASNAEHTASVVQEVVVMIAESMKNAQEGAKVGEEAKRSATDGVGAMNRIEASMSEIQTASNQVADIIEVINEITHQTKMLATNAAIEAARAGEQGKGFAVVADEVSKLAENSKTAAKEIGGLIKEASAKSEAGVHLVQQGTKVLEGLLEASNQVADLSNAILQSSELQTEKSSTVNEMVAEIRTASVEQAVGVEQVTMAIAQLDQVTQANAANAEESAAAAEELNSQADSVQDLVSNMGLHFGVDAESNAQGNPIGKTHIKPHQLQRESVATTNVKAASTTPTQIHRSSQRKVQPADQIPMRDDFKDF